MTSSPLNTAEAKQNQSLPFFFIEAGKSVVYSPDGQQKLPDDWTGLLCEGGNVKNLWFFGREDGERSFSKLMASTKSDALAEIQSLARTPQH